MLSPEGTHMIEVRRLSRIVALVVASVTLASCNPPLPPQPTSAPPTSAPAAAQPTAAQAAQGAATPLAPSKPVPTPPAIAAGQAAAAAQPTVTSNLDQLYAQLYPAAKQEGKLVLYGVGTMDLFEPIRAGFVNHFPGIEVQGVDQRGRETLQKVTAEQQSQNYVGDVAISGTDTQAELVKDGYTETYQPAEIGNAIPGLVPAGGAMSPRTLTIFTIQINTNLVPPGQEPKTWLDALDPKWKGKVAMDDPRGSGPGGTIISGLDYLYGQEIEQKIADLQPFFATQAGPIWTGLDRGEYAIYLSGGHTDLISNKRAGAPVKQIDPSDGVGVTPIGQSLLTKAPHPNAAKLWIEWSLSDEGQNLLAQQGYAVVRKGVKAVEPEANLEGVKFLPRDDDNTKLQLIPERTKRWDELFFKTN
jgi:iron(III) transport system substrate-binding protein